MVTILDTSPHWVGNVAKKTKGLKSKPLTSLIDKSVIHLFLLNTLEAQERLTADAMLCIGEAGEPWQQSSSKLMKDYDLVGIDADGWMEWHPKPTKMVEFFEVTEEMGEGYIIGRWGQTIDGVAGLQRTRPGDFVARQLSDMGDQWVVAKNIWNRTYEEVFTK